MAPEVIMQIPGTFSVINYAKSDLWAAGTIAYELFGMKNPFYETENGNKLRSVDYTEDDLPTLPDDVPNVVKALVSNMLSRNPKKRLDVETAANVCQLLLWAPSDWLKSTSQLPSSAEILQWLLCLTTKVLCEGRLNTKKLYEIAETATTMTSGAEKTSSRSISYANGRRTYPEYLLISSFLIRAKLSYLRKALVWIHNV